MGVIPTLVKLLGIHCHNAALTEMCLVAFGNLAELGKSTSQAISVINFLVLVQWLFLYELGIHLNYFSFSFMYSRYFVQC